MNKWYPQQNRQVVKQDEEDAVITGMVRDTTSQVVMGLILVGGLDLTREVAMGPV